MNFPLYIAKRYLRSKSSNNAINFITIIAGIGVVLASAALFVVLSGFAGLKDFTLQFSTIADPDLKAQPSLGKSFVLTKEQEQSLMGIEEIVSFSKIIEEQVIVSFDDKNYPALIKGIDKNYPNVNAVDSIIVQGDWVMPNSRQIVVGLGISNNLSFGVLDYGKHVTLYVPKSGKGQLTSVKKAFNSVNAINVGLFDINETLNDTYVYAPLDMAQELLSYKFNQVSAIEFKIEPEADEDIIKQKIQSILGEDFIVKNRAQLNDALHKMLNTENLFVYLIFTLVLIIALFNVVGSIIMMILDKKNTLNTLFKLGATIKDIRKIFFLQGSLMVVIGGLLGLILGFVIVVLQQHFSLVMITPSLPYPVAIKVINFLIVFVTISILGVLAARIASARISEKLIEF